MNESEENNDNDIPQSFLSQGNKHFIYKRFSSAISDYTQGLKYFMVQESTDAAEEVEAESSGDHHCDSSGDVENGPRKNSSSRKLKQSKVKKEKRNNAKKYFVSLSNLNCNSVFLELLSNRALVYLSIGNYSAALQDTRHLLDCSPGHFKGIIRHAKALAGLRQYQNAINFLTNVRKGLTGKEDKGLESSREVIRLIERLRRMKHQSETGDYFDISQIMEKHYEPAPEDWVDYIGPVKVVSVEGKGRGLVAVQDLPAGKLIFACRAFEIIFLGKDCKPGEGISEESGEALKGGHFKVEDDATLNLLARKIYDRLVRNKEKRQEFYQLHAGNDLGHLDPLPGNNGDSECHPLDMARIYGICRTNTFANAGDSYPEVEKSVGLWIFPAYVNHQCIGGNCTWKIFSDFIFFRTYRPVKKGDELVVSYVSPAFSFKARNEVLTKRLGFICPCVLCELDRALPQSFQDDKDRLKMLANNQEVKFAQLDPNQEGSEGEYRKKVETSILLLEQIIQKLEKIQPKHGIYNASLLDPLQKLGLKYFGIGEFHKMTRVMERACSLMKSCMLPHGVADCSLWIIAAYMQMGNFKQAKKWGKVLKEYLMLAYGDLMVLKVLGGWAIEPMTQWGLLK